MQQPAQPIYNSKTGIFYASFEKKLMKIKKGGIEQEIEVITGLPRGRMQIRVSNINLWHKNDTLTIQGKDVIYTCKVTSINRNKKIVIKKIAENKPENLTPKEQETAKEL